VVVDVSSHLVLVEPDDRHHAESHDDHDGQDDVVQRFPSPRFHAALSPSLSAVRSTASMFRLPAPARPLVRTPCSDGRMPERRVAPHSKMAVPRLLECGAFRRFGFPAPGPSLTFRYVSPSRMEGYRSGG